MSEFKKYPSIGKFTDVLHDVKKKTKRKFLRVDTAEDGTKTPVFEEGILPTLEFRGTVKLHGTNACIVINSDLSVDAQSRTRILSLTSDNHGFCNWLVGKREVFIDAYKEHLNSPDVYSLHVYGEWCGSNIQSNVGLTGIEKTFIIFSILQTNVDNIGVWLSPESINYLSDKVNNIRNIYEFPDYKIEIDFNDPSTGLQLADNIRDEIDAVCPVAKLMGSTSDETHGEGNVWRCTTEGYTHLSFKHKGESHQRSGKKPKQQKVGVVLTEEQQLVFDNFIQEAVTVDRLAQGVEFLKEQDLTVSQKNTGVYLAWFLGDVKKECKHEITELSKNSIPWNIVTKPITTMAREFLFSNIA